MRTNQTAIDLDDYLDANLADRAQDKFMALPDFYKSSDNVERYTNIEDAVASVYQAEWIIIARALRDENDLTAGRLLKFALQRICNSQAEEELEEEFEAGKPQADALAERADYLRQRERDDKIDFGG